MPDPRDPNQPPAGELRDPAAEIAQLRAQMAEMRDLALRAENAVGQLERLNAELIQRLGVALEDLYEVREELHDERHDNLTGIPNRGYVTELGIQLMQEERTRPAGNRREAAAPRTIKPQILFIDVRNLKKLNDKLGHKAADVLLNAVGKALKNVVEEDVPAGRWGGDEFIVILPPSSDRELALAREKAIADDAFEAFVDGVHTNQELFFDDLRQDHTLDECKDVARQWFMLTVGHAELEVGPTDDLETAFEELVEAGDLDMYREKVLQRLADDYDTLRNDLDALAERGIKGQFSLQWFDENIPTFPESQAFRTRLSSYLENLAEVGAGIVERGQPWVKKALPNDLAPDRDARVNIAVMQDLAFIAQERQRFGVTDEREVMPRERLRSDPVLMDKLAAVKTRDYTSWTSVASDRSALDFEVPLIGPQPGWSTFTSKSATQMQHPSRDAGPGLV